MTGEDYLWDPKAAPTPDVQQLEESLASARHQATTYRKPTPGHPLAVGGLVTVVALSAALALTLRQSDRTGRWIEPQQPVTIDVGELGHVTVAPKSRLRVLETDDETHRMELARGSIEAFVVAPPRMFFVETPSGVAVDLGCAYTLDVDDDGAGLLAVTLGEVALQRGRRVSTVPAGASCTMHPTTGPGTPVFDDASAAFKNELGRLDAGEPAIEGVLSHARVRDSLSLYHLLSVVDEPTRPKVLDRLHELVPMPADVTRDDALTLDDKVLYVWWNAIEASW